MMGCKLCLSGSLNVGGTWFEPGATGAYPMPTASDGLPTLYRFSEATDPARVVFVTQ